MTNSGLPLWNNTKVGGYPHRPPKALHMVSDIRGMMQWTKDPERAKYAQPRIYLTLTLKGANPVILRSYVI